MQNPSFSLVGKIAVITGASRGIGRALAEGIAAAGASVILLGRDAASLESVRSGLPGAGAPALCITADVTDVAQIDAAFAQISAAFPRLDILINNAGVEEVRPSRDVTEALWDRIIDTNLKGAFFCAQAAVRHMSRGGCVINICSLTSEVGVAGAAPYGASKSGLAGLTRTLAAEWAADGIRVNGIGPGYFRTALTESFYADAQWQRNMLAKIPMGRFGQLEDIVGAAVFLCSNAAAYVTGQIVYVDGGYLAAL